MPKRTAVIDIGSNSARLVIFERTSRFGFHLICEQKSRVRIGEGAYEKGGYLQAIGIERAYLALQSFTQTTKKYKVDKVLCIATSALRDAPNRQEFVSWIRSHLGVSISVIDGDAEAKLGAIAANNLLPIENAITIDIGGGSSDLARIEDNKIVETYSLNIGTVRIKELFMDHNRPIEEAQLFIREELDKLPASFRHSLAVGIGGTARALSKAIMKRTQYPLDKLHAFCYSLEEEEAFLQMICDAQIEDLKKLYVKNSRYDTIREGTLIFLEILHKIAAKDVMSSGVGVRDGVFLKDLLRHSALRFPAQFNPSQKSILDRFNMSTVKNSHAAHRTEIASQLYAICHKEFALPLDYKQSLKTALKLSNIGKRLTIYKSRHHAFYIAIEELNFGFTHQEIVLIATLLRTTGNTLFKKSLFQMYKKLLPPKDVLKCLSFINNISILIHENSNNAKINFSYEGETLTIESNQSLYHAKESIYQLEKPKAFEIVIRDKETIPKYTF